MVIFEIRILNKYLYQIEIESYIIPHFIFKWRFEIVLEVVKLEHNNVK